MTRTETPIESLADALSAAVPTLDPAEQRLALGLYRMLLHGRPVALEDLAQTVGMESAEAHAALGRWPGVYRDADGRIIGFWGLAISDMPHGFTTLAGRITAWCAIDPLLIGPLVTDEAQVESADPVTGESVRLTVTPSGVRDLDPPGAAVSMLAPDGPFDHEVVETFCNFVHFFASRVTADRWVADHPGTFALTVDEAFEVATRSWPRLFRDVLAAERGEMPA